MQKGLLTIGLCALKSGESSQKLRKFEYPQGASANRIAGYLTKIFAIFGRFYRFLKRANQLSTDPSIPA